MLFNVKIDYTKTFLNCFKVVEKVYSTCNHNNTYKQTHINTLGSNNLSRTIFSYKEVSKKSQRGLKDAKWHSQDN